MNDHSIPPRRHLRQGRLTLHQRGPWGLLDQGLHGRLPQRQEVGTRPRRDAGPLEGGPKGPRHRRGGPGDHRVRRNL